MKLTKVVLRASVVGVGAVALALAGLVVAGPAGASVTSVTGSADGVTGNILGVSVPASLDPTVSLPPGGTASGIALGSLIGVPTVTSTSANVPGPSGSVTSTTTIVNVDIPGVLTSGAIVTTCTSGSSGSTGSVTIVNGFANGQPLPTGNLLGTAPTILPNGTGFINFGSQTQTNTTGSTSITVNGPEVDIATALGGGPLFLLLGQVTCSASGPDVNPAPTTTTTTTTSGTTTTTTSAAPTITRVAGPDRVATSIAVSQQAFPATGSAQAVVVARDDAFPDALIGVPLAHRVGGPLLLTPPASQSSTLAPAVLTEIKRVAPSGANVYLLGGSSALAPGIDIQLTTAGYRPVRVAGVDEDATAVAIAQALGNPKVILEATNTDFADALSADAAAVNSSGAILLTNGTTQSPETAAYLAAHSGDTRYALGGPAAQADPTATPFVGTDRFATAVMVAGHFSANPTTLGVARGDLFPDALVGAAQVATHGGPMVLVQPTSVPSSTATYLSTAKATVTSTFVFGGTAAVSGPTYTEVAADLGATSTN